MILVQTNVNVRPRSQVILLRFGSYLVRGLWGSGLTGCCFHWFWSRWGWSQGWPGGTFLVQGCWMNLKMMQELKAQNNKPALAGRSCPVFPIKSFLFWAALRWVCGRTCWGGVLRLEQSHHALAVEASWAEQHRFRPWMLPTDDGQAVVPVTTGHFVQTAVLYCLRDHQQPRVTDGEAERKANLNISFTMGTRNVASHHTVSRI